MYGGTSLALTLLLSLGKKNVKTNKQKKTAIIFTGYPAVSVIWPGDLGKGRRKMEEGTMQIKRHGLTFTVKGTDRASWRKGTLQFWEGQLSWAGTHRRSYGRVGLNFLSPGLALLFLPVSQLWESFRQEATSCWLRLLQCLVGRVVLWEEGRGLVWLSPGPQLPPADFLLVESPTLLGTTTWDLSSSPPLHWALSIWMSGSQALGPWPTAHLRLSLLLSSGLCNCESSHWAIGCLQKNPVFSGSYCSFQLLLPRKEGIRLKGTHPNLPPSPRSSPASFREARMEYSMGKLIPPHLCWGGSWWVLPVNRASQCLFSKWAWPWKDCHCEPIRQQSPSLASTAAAGSGSGEQTGKNCSTFYQERLWTKAVLCTESWGSVASGTNWKSNVFSF